MHTLFEIVLLFVPRTWRRLKLLVVASVESRPALPHSSINRAASRIMAAAGSVRATGPAAARLGQGACH
eukprot:6374850-Amphidinium_carterae.2